MVLTLARRGWRRIAGPEASLSQIPLAAMRRIFGKYFKVTIDGAPFTLDLRDTIVSFDILTRRRDGFLRGPIVYEPEESAIIRRLVRSGDRVIDVGAHIGFYSTLFGRLVGSGGRVLSVEPHPDNLEVLHMNLSENGLDEFVRVAPVAVGAGDGSATLFTNPHGNRGDNRLYRSEGAEQAVVTVPIRAVDVLVNDWDRVDLIKMDVQGYEPAALLGMHSTLASNHGVILCTEFWPYGLRSAGNDPQAMLDTLTSHGFELAEITAGKLEPVDPSALIGKLAGINHTDLVCARPGVLAERFNRGGDVP